MSRIWQCDRCHKDIKDYQLDKNHVLIYNKRTTEPVLFQYEGSVPMEGVDLCDECMEDYNKISMLFMYQDIRLEPRKYDPKNGALIINW